jgi:hypothetical protein
MGLIDRRCSLKSVHLKETQIIIAYINAVMPTLPQFVKIGA